MEAWPSLFSDIRSLKVRGREGSRWKLDVTSTILGGHAHEYLVEVKEPATITLKMNLTGVNAHGTIQLTSSGENRAQARFELYAATSGVGGWFVSEKTLRQKQEALVEAYLRDLARASGASP